METKLKIKKFQKGTWANALEKEGYYLKEGGKIQKAQLGAILRALRKAASTTKKIYNQGGYAKVKKTKFGVDIKWRGKGMGSHIEVSRIEPGEQWLHTLSIKSTKPGTGRKLYDAAIKYAQQEGYKGLVTGENLVSAPKTYHTWEHYPNKVLIGNYGVHMNTNMLKGDVPYRVVYSPEQLVEATKNNVEAFLDDAAVYGLTEPTKDIPIIRKNGGILQ